MPDLERQHYLAEIDRLTKLVDILTSTVTAQTDTIAEMSAKIDALQQTIKDLTERVNKNSRNSSKPPSSDGYQNQIPKASGKSPERSRAARKDIPEAT